MKTHLSLDLPRTPVRVHSPGHLYNCIFLRFAPDSGIQVEAILRVDEAQKLAEYLLAAADHALTPPDVPQLERDAEFHRRAAARIEAQMEDVRGTAAK